MNIGLIDIIFDLILLATVAFGAIYGAKRGVIKVIQIPFRMVSSFILALLASVYLSSSVVLPLIEKPVVDKMSAYIVKRCTEDDKIPLLYRLLGVDSQAVEGGMEAVARDLVSPLVTIISVAITFFVTLIIGKLIITLVFNLVNLIFKIGALNKVSKILGAVLGALVFYIIASLLAAVAMLCDSIGLLDRVQLLSTFDGGYVYKLMTAAWGAFF